MAKATPDGNTDAQRKSAQFAQDQFDYNKGQNLDDINRQAAEAARLRALEAERQNRISAGLAKVDKILEPFDNKFYNGLKSKYVSAYLPEIGRQYGQAQQENLFSLARNGNVDSSAAATASGDLASQRGGQELALRQRANGYAGQARANTEARRTALTNEVYSTADPSSVNAQGVATGERVAGFQQDPTQFIVPGMDFSPLGNLFTTAATGLGAYNQAQAYNAGGGGTQVSSFLQRKTNEGKNVN